MSENDTILAYSQKLWPEFTINKSLLEHPTSEFVREFYIRFASAITAILISTGEEETIQPEEDYTSTKIIQLINYALHNSELGDRYEVTLADLYAPTAKRTKIRFKCLLHLLTYFNERQEPIQEKVLEVENVKQQLGLKQQEKKKAKENLGKIAEDVSRLANNKDKVKKEFKLSQQKFEKMQEEEKQNQLQLTKSREDLKKLVATYENNQTRLNNLKSSVESLTIEIVPEDNYQSLNTLLTNLKKNSAELDADAEALNGSLELKMTEMKRFHNINEELKELLNRATKLKSSQNLVIECEKNATEIDNDIKTATNKLTELNGEIIKHQENVQNLKVQLKSVNAHNKNLIKNTQLEIADLDKKINDEVLYQNKIASEKEEVNNNTQALSNEYNRLTNECEQLRVTYTNTYKNVLGNFNSVTTNVHATFENLKKPFSDITN